MEGEMYDPTEETTEGDNADLEDSAAAEEASKTEEEIEKALKETHVTIPRYAPHPLPDWHLDSMRERWMWNLRIYPIDQEDCRNCILDAATKLAQESWFYVPKRKNGQGHAELCMESTNEAVSVMSRVVRMPYYHRYVTIEVTRRALDRTETAYKHIVESATYVLDSTKCEKIKNTATSRGNLKRRRLWVRYLSENTSPEILRVLFPLSQSAEVQSHDNLCIGLVETNSKTDVLIFIKAFITLIINGTHILALQNKEPEDNESGVKAELEKSVLPLSSLQEAPIEIADRGDTRASDGNQANRSLKRTLTQQYSGDDRKGKNRQGGRGEPPAKRGGGGGNWGGDRRYDNRRNSGGRYGGGGSGGYGYPPPLGGYGGALTPEDMAAEMMIMQAQLNQTIQNQLMMLNTGGPGSRGGRYGGGAIGGGGRYGGGGAGGGRGGGGRKNYGGGW